MSMLFKRIKDWATRITAFRTGDVIPVDGPSGTAKMGKDDLLRVTAENALGSIHSLSDTATEADLVAGNYFTLDGSAGTKKLPAEDVAKSSVQGKTTLSFIKLEQGGINIYGYPTTNTIRLRSVNYIVGNVTLTAPAGFIFGLICYYNETTKEFVSYTDVDGPVANIGLTGCVAKFIIQKIDGTETITPDEVQVYNDRFAMDAEQKALRAEFDTIDADFAGLEKDVRGADYMKTALRRVEITGSFEKDDVAEFWVEGEGISSDDISVLGYTDSETFETILKASTTKKTKVLAKDYIKVVFYDNSQRISYTAKVHIDGHKQAITSNTQHISVLEKSVDGETITTTGSTRLIDVVHSFEKGATVEFSGDGNDAEGDEIAVFGYIDSNNYESIGYFDCGQTTKKVMLEKDYVKVRFYNNSASVGFTAIIDIYGVEKDISDLKEATLKKPIKFLIIGDSYTAVADYWRKYFLPKMPKGSQIKTTAVIGASVKDKYQDRTTYPYTSRPTSSDYSGNLNTFGSQLEKLERLMTGVDLDSGETQWYANPSDYPDVIIIEGGMNDGFDADTSHYIEQFVEEVTNVYYKEKPTSAIAQGNCYVKSDIEQINRTTFAGAYRYICETLRKKFPDALLFMTTCSNLGYWDYNLVERRQKIAEQQRYCAHICGASLIDWQDCQISCLTTYPGGSGTSEDPYTLYGNDEDFSDSNDAMHPNTRGAKKLGEYTANVILNKLSNILV